MVEPPKAHTHRLPGEAHAVLVTLARRDMIPPAAMLTQLVVKAGRDAGVVPDLAKTHTPTKGLKPGARKEPEAPKTPPRLLVDGEAWVRSRSVPVPYGGTEPMTFWRRVCWVDDNPAGRELASFEATDWPTLKAQSERIQAKVDAGDWREFDIDAHATELPQARRGHLGIYEQTRAGRPIP